MSKSIIVLSATRQGYSPDQCPVTLTVEELIATLEDFPLDTEVYFGNDPKSSYWYTYGSIDGCVYEADVDDDGCVTALW